MTGLAQPLNPKMTGKRVAELHAILIELGYTVAKTELEERRYGATTERAVRLLQAELALDDTGTVDEETARGINERMSERGGREPKPRRAAGHAVTVNGTVRDEDGEGVQGLEVTALERRLRGSTPLKSGTTDAHGAYKLRFEPPRVPAGGAAFKLVLQITDAAKKVLYESEPLSGSGVQEVNFMAGGKEYHGPSELEARVAEIDPLLEGVAIAELTETAGVHDISFLSHQTGLSPDDVMRIVVCYRLSARTGLAPAIFYAFLRQGIPPSQPASLLEASAEFTLIEPLERSLESGIFMTASATQERALQTALDANYIPMSYRAQIPQLIEELRRHQSETALSQPLMTGKTSLKEVLSVSSLSPAKYTTFAQAYAARTGTLQQFWTELAASNQLTPAELADVRGTLEVGFFTKNYLPLITTIKKQLGEQGGSVRDLAGYDLQQWTQLIGQAAAGGAAGFPENIAGETAAQKTAAFATEIMQRVQRAHPTTALVAYVQREQAIELQARQETLAFLQSNPDLDLRSTSLDAYIHAKGGEALAKVPEQQRPLVVADAKTLQRALRLAPHPDVAGALLASGYHSAVQIYSAGYTRFVGLLAGKGVAQIDARKVYYQAEQRYAMLLLRLSEYNAQFNKALPVVIGSVQPSGETLETINQFPSLTTLFGSQDFCDCEQCNSVYSAAAYLTDILRFLRGRASKQPNRSAQEILFDRRPDLGTILLNCENTNTEVPYIDLACELLEDAVSPPGAPIARQTTLTAAELRANPEYLNEAAFETLRTASYPLSLPFHLWLTESRTYLGQLGITRWGLMRAFQNRAAGSLSPTDAEIAGEYFSLSEFERGLVVTENQAGQAAYWNAVNPVATLTTVSTFLDRSSLSYDQLRELLALNFVQVPAGTAVSEIERLSDDCDTSKQQVSNLTLLRLDHVHRLLRLWRRCGWQLWELDRLIACPAVGNGVLDENTLVALWQAAELQKRLELSVEELLAFYAPLNTEIPEPNPSSGHDIYRRLFLNPAVVNPPLEAFSVANVTAAAPAASVADFSGPISGALTITAGDLAKLVPLTDGRLSLATLSALYRYGRLAAAMSVSVSDLLDLIARVAVPDPFAALTVTNALVDAQQDINSAGLSLELLDYVLDYRPESASAPRVGEVTANLIQLRSERQKVRDQFFTSSEASTAVLASRLAALPDLSAPAPGQPDLVAEAMSIVTGAFEESAAERQSFIEDHLASFLEVADAMAHLGPVPGVTPRQVAAFLKGEPAAAMGLTNAAAQQLEGEISTRCEYVLERLYAFTAANRIEQLLGGMLGLPDEQATLLLTSLHLQGSPLTLLQVFGDEALLAKAANGKDYAQDVTPATFPAVFEAYGYMAKLSSLILTMKMTSAELNWVLAHAADYGGLQLELLPTRTPQGAAPFSTWQSLAHLLRFKRSRPEPEGVSFLEIVAGVSSNTPAQTAEALSKLTGWKQADIETVTTALGLQYPADYQQVDAYERISACFALLSRSGVDPTALAGWAATEPDAAGAANVKQAVKARYDVETWLSVAASLQDTVREDKRAALVAYLVAHPELDPSTGAKWANDNQLYAHFLIDVDMCACQVTSRIVQAYLAVQLFVQRCLINLEPEMLADPAADDVWAQWEWMKRYRLWEANRKIFLYPENWLLPETRSNKSPLFQTLQDSLSQSDVTEEVVSDAFLGYLSGLDDVAHLKVCGVYHEDIGTREVLHVIARTTSQPAVFHYRRRDEGTWSAWEKIEVDIKSDQVLPVVWQGRMHLFWPLLKSKPWPKQEIPAAKESPTPPPTDAKRYWEVQLAWTRIHNGKWTHAQISERTLMLPDNPDYYFTLKAQDREDHVAVQLFLREESPTEIAEFRFDGDVAELKVTPIEYMKLADFGDELREVRCLTTVAPALALPYSAQYEYNSLLGSGKTLGADGTSQLWVLKSDGLRVDNGELLKSAKWRSELMVPHQDAQFDSTRPFFYQDSARAYFILPTKWWENGSRFTPDVPPSSVAGRYEIKYEFTEFYHPYVRLFIRELNSLQLPGLLRRQTQVTPELLPPGNTFSFAATYQPASSLISVDSDKEFVDFSAGGAYSLYNWELFFHAPLMIAMRLSQNQRFEEAMRWFQYIFNPTSISSEPAPQRYWITKPFYLTNTAQYQQQQIENLLKEVNHGQPDYEQQVKTWRDHPFDPHLIASTRWTAYQKCVVMRYLDNLIAWGDSLFSTGSREALGEATQLYVMADEILGPRPRDVPAPQRVADKSFDDIAADLDAFGNVLVEVENTLPPTGLVAPTAAGSEPLPSFEGFYFCIPPNDQLLAYWDTVADRLFKLRHCLNIEGVATPLALFDPPIDPGLLVKAAAAGIDLSSVLNETNAPLPNYRFQAVLARAREFCGELRSLGAAMLQALEKRDAEELGRLRSSQEVALLRAVATVRERQLTESQAQLAALEQSKVITKKKHEYYASRPYMNAWEITQVALAGAGTIVHGAALLSDVLAGVAFLVPDFQLGASGFGGSPHVTAKEGGTNVGKAAERGANGAYQAAVLLDKFASMAATQAGYQRRSEDWTFQAEQAEAELPEIEQQILVAQIRVAIAELEVSNQGLQIKNATAVDEQMHTKFTNEELYDWMITKLSTVYFQAYQLAFDVAQRAERCFRYELGLKGSSFVQFGYWDSLKKGLLSGEQLGHDLNRMEAAYLEQNSRPREITKNISLAELDPASLLRLKQTGKCDIDIPETLFDLDYPGHYMRRIASIAMTIPSVSGPYSSVNCTLTLTRNSVRTSTTVGNSYPRSAPGTTDERFVDQIAAEQSIATSDGQNDSGLFELGFHDERYLPFEGAGAISSWHIDLPPETNNFDFNTITDVILHMRYTARDAGGLLQAAAHDAVAAAMPREGVRLFSARHDFPDAWARFLSPPPAGQDQAFDVTLAPNNFPYWTRSRTIEVTDVEIFADSNQVGDINATLTPLLPPTTTLHLAADPTYAGLHHIAQPLTSATIGSWELKLSGPSGDYHSLTPDLLQDVFLLVHFEVK